MTKAKKYGEVTVLYSKRVPLSKKEAVVNLVENFLAQFESNKAIVDPLCLEHCASDKFMEKLDMAKRSPEEYMQEQHKIWQKNSEINSLVSSDESLVSRLATVVDKVNRVELKKAQKKIKKPIDDPVSFDWPRPSMEEVEKRFNAEVVKKNGGVVKFSCGCFIDGVLFRRFPGCTIENENHKK
jgi:hypothetical protein